MDGGCAAGGGDGVGGDGVGWKGVAVDGLGHGRLEVLNESNDAF